MTWAEIAIGDLGRIVTGDTPPRKNPEYYGSAYPFIKPTDMTVGQRLTMTYEEGYSEDGFAKYRKKLIPAGSTAVVTIGSIGQKLTWLHADSFVNQAVNAVVPDRAKFDSLYVYYLLKHNLNLVKQADTGASSGRENVSKSNFSALTVWACLDLNTQKQIAEVLDALDSSIETNQRRIALLEDAARRLYREWFVHLRFPGHESVPVKDGVPEGWAKLPLGDVAEITMGQSPESKYYNTDGDGLPFHQGVSDFGHRFVKHEAYTKQATRIAEAGDILCSVRAPVGRLNFTRDKIAIGRGLSAMRSRTGHQSLLFYQLDALFVEEDMIGGGAIFASVGKKELFGQLILQPSTSIATTFNRLVSDLDLQIENLDSQNQELAKARDLLLPKLMSGQLDVSGIALPDEVAA